MRGYENSKNIVRTRPVLDENSKYVEEIAIPPEKRQEISIELRHA